MCKSSALLLIACYHFLFILKVFFNLKLEHIMEVSLQYNKSKTKTKKVLYRSPSAALHCDVNKRLRNSIFERSFSSQKVARSQFDT